MRVGFGYDVHKLEKNRNLILGGVKIESEYGLLGHSDADVLIHAIMDSVLGATALRDVGYHFSDTDPKFKDADSLKLLESVMHIIKTEYPNFIILNVDSTIVMQYPKISKYIPGMVKNISKVLAINENQLNIKATTTERLGFEGRKEGISCYAVSLISI